MNTADLLTEAARERPGHLALQFEDQDFTYDEVDRHSSRFADVLSGRGIGAGEVAAIFLESGPELVFAYLGELKAGVVPNVVNAMLKADEVRAVVADSGARLLLTDAERWEALGDAREGLGVPADDVLLAETDSTEDSPRSFRMAMSRASDRFTTLDRPAEATACLLYTSGTTGRPKGVMLSHRNITDNALQFSRIHYRAEDRLLVAAPLFHCWGLINGVLGIFAARATARIIRRYRTKTVLDLIERTRPTVFLGVPTMVNYMAKSPGVADRDRSSLRSILCAAAPMPLELIDVVRRDWGVGYAESYGLTETSPVITTTSPDAMRPGSCGRAMGDTELRVVNADGSTLPVGAVGELWARGTAISAGYYGQPQATAAVFTADGWFRTGDIVRMDEDGYVSIVDRVKDMINVAGEKVYPRDVEELLHRHPYVADAAIVGIPDPDRGEAVKAYVALNPGQTWTAGDLIDYLRPLLAAFKLPTQVEFVAEIPRSPSGKALRRLLR